MALTDQNIVLAARLGIDLSEPKPSLIESIIQKINISGRLIIEVGLSIKALKSACEHGEFLSTLEQINLSHQRASEFVRYADFASALKEAEINKVLGLAKKKVLALAAADVGTISELLDSDEAFDAVTALSPIEMRRQLKKLEADKENLKAQLKSKDTQIRRLNQSKYDGATQPYPEHIAAARCDSFALSEKARLCLDDLSQLHADHMDLINRAGDPRGIEYWDVGAIAIYHNTRAVVAQAVALMKKLEAELPENIRDDFTAEHFYSDEEILKVKRDHALIVQLHKHDAIVRENNRKVGPGRPRKAD